MKVGRRSRNHLSSGHASARRFAAHHYCGRECEAKGQPGVECSWTLAEYLLFYLSYDLAASSYPRHKRGAFRLVQTTHPTWRKYGIHGQRGKSEVEDGNGRERHSRKASKKIKNGVDIGSVQRKCQVKGRWLDGGDSVVGGVLLECEGICIGTGKGSNGNS